LGRTAGREVVEYADAVVAPQQLFDGIRAVKPAAAGDEIGHEVEAKEEGGEDYLLGLVLRRISTNSDPP
jgi:acyl dehydratase